MKSGDTLIVLIDAITNHTSWIPKGSIVFVIDTAYDHGELTLTLLTDESLVVEVEFWHETLYRYVRKV